LLKGRSRTTLLVKPRRTALAATAVGGGPTAAPTNASRYL